MSPGHGVMALRHGLMLPGCIEMCFKHSAALPGKAKLIRVTSTMCIEISFFPVFFIFISLSRNMYIM